MYIYIDICTLYKGKKWRSTFLQVIFPSCWLHTGSKKAAGSTPPSGAAGRANRWVVRAPCHGWLRRCLLLLWRVIPPFWFPMMKWTTCCTLGFVASFTVQSLQLVGPMYTGHSHSSTFQNAQVHFQPVQIVEHDPCRELGLGSHSLIEPRHCAGSSHIFSWIDLAHPCAPWPFGRSTVAVGVSTPLHPRRGCAQLHPGAAHINWTRNAIWAWVGVRSLAMVDVAPQVSFLPWPCLVSLLLSFPRLESKCLKRVGQLLWLSALEMPAPRLAQFYAFQLHVGDQKVTGDWGPSCFVSLLTYKLRIGLCLIHIERHARHAWRAGWFLVCLLCLGAPSVSSLGPGPIGMVESMHAQKDSMKLFVHSSPVCLFGVKIINSISAAQRLGSTLVLASCQLILIRCHVDHAPDLIKSDTWEPEHLDHFPLAWSICD